MHKITVYSTNFCPYCTLAKDWLKKQGFKFIEKNVESDSTAAKEMIKKSGQRGVPVIDVDGKIVVGFDKAKLYELLGIEE